MLGQQLSCVRKKKTPAIETLTNEAKKDYQNRDDGHKGRNVDTGSIKLCKIKIKDVKSLNACNRETWRRAIENKMTSG